MTIALDEESTMTQQYTSKDIRNLLTRGLSAEELQQLCFYAPQFKPVCERLAGTMSKHQIVHRLIEYAEQRGLLEELVAEAKEINSTLFSQSYSNSNYPNHPINSSLPRDNNRTIVGTIFGVVVVILLFMYWQYGNVIDLPPAASISTIPDVTPPIQTLTPSTTPLPHINPLVTSSPTSSPTPPSPSPTSTSTSTSTSTLNPTDTSTAKPPKSTATEITAPTKGAVTVAPTSTSTIQTIDPTFETFETDTGLWTVGDEKNGTLVRSSAKSREGQYSGQINYNFTSTENDYVVFLKSCPWTRRPTGVTADVWGDGSGHFLNVWVEDSLGQTWAFTFGQIEHEGWQTMTAVFDPSLGWPNEPVKGPNNKVIDYPLSFQALVLDDAPDNINSSGVIYVDNLTTTFDQLPESESLAATAAPPVDDPVATETPATPPSPSGLAGRIAFPVDRSGYYDIWIADLSTLPDVSPFNAMKGARQPNFNKKDGRLLANGEDNLGDRNLRLYSSNFNYLNLVSESPFDAYPFWAPGGERLTYSRDNNDRIYLNCSVTRPSWDTVGECSDLESGIIITERRGHLVAEMPVWMQDGSDLIVRWLEPSKAGLARIGSWATHRDKDPIDPLPEPVSLLGSTTARPTDTYGQIVYFFAADLDDNWEVYALNVNEGTPVNLSNSSGSNDGLPTVSPDGRWVAFASDRDDRWAIWAVPAQGGTPQKLFDMPKANPWGQGAHDWITERISWGP